MIRTRPLCCTVVGRLCLKQKRVSQRVRLRSLCNSSLPVQCKASFTCESGVVTQDRRLVPITPSHANDYDEYVPLTVVDVQMRHEQLPFAYFFEETLDVDMLAASLERLLRWYPILGGSMDFEAGRIECKPGDTVPFTFAKSNKTLTYWINREKGHSYRGGCGHPELMPLFDPLFASKDVAKQGTLEDVRFDDLVTIQVTHCEGGGTIIGVNMNHALGDAASCIRFVQCWGREMRQKEYPRGASNDRSSATCSGMMTAELSELMGFQRVPDSVIPEFVASYYNEASAYWDDLVSSARMHWEGAFPMGLQGALNVPFHNQTTEAEVNSKTPLVPITTTYYDEAAAYFETVSVQQPWSGVEPVFSGAVANKLSLLDGEVQSGVEMSDAEDSSVKHVYVQLPFSPTVLKAMKAYGMVATLNSAAPGEGNTNEEQVGKTDAEFVSTNDMVTAFGWLMKRQLSGEMDWNMSMVVNLRGRCGVDSFSFMANTSKEGVFGNGITNVIASLPATTKDLAFGIGCIADAAIAIRKALTAGLRNVPDRIAQSRMGRPVSSAAMGPSFSTTSWGQFPLWDIGFTPKRKLSSFHGHPSHPLPAGRTFSSVIAPRQDGGYVYKLLMPSDKAEEARLLHEQLCTAFIDWHSTIDPQRC